MKNREMIKIRLLSRYHHNAQIVTGFQMLGHRNPVKYRIEIENAIHEDLKGNDNPPAIVEVEYCGKRIAYDTNDGYFDGIEKYVRKYDFYFKRSFSLEKNKQFLGSELAERVYPLDFNYFVTYKENPYNFIDGKDWKYYARMLMGRKNSAYFVPERFTTERSSSTEKIIFMARLWQPDQKLPKRIQDERVYINEMRIEILDRLRRKYGNQFIGGLTDDAFTREVAAE